MATSNQVGAVTTDIATILEHAFLRCRLPAAAQTPENVRYALESLQFLLNEYSNYGLNLWAIEKLIVGLHRNQETYPLPPETVDVLNVFLRNSPRAEGVVSSSDGQSTTTLTDGDVTTSLTQLVTGGSFSITFSEAAAVRTVGLLHKGAATRSLVFETSPDAVTWTQVKSLGAVTYSDRQWIWSDIDPAGVAQLHFRVRDTLTNMALAAYEFYVSTGGTEIQAARLNRDDFTNLPQKFISGRPLQFWFDRQVKQPVLRVWPSPDNVFDQYIVWRHRLVQDVGDDLTLEIEVPQKWREAVVAGLAVKVAMEVPQVDPQLIPILSQMADLALTKVELDEFDNSVINLRPNLSLYTRFGGGRGYGRR